MKNLALVLGVLLVFSGFASADEYLLSTCESIMNNDLSNMIVVNDFDLDGTPNILLGTKINGNLYNYVYRGADCTLDWTYTKGGWVFDTPGNVKSVWVGALKGGETQFVVNSVQATQNQGTKPKEYVYVISKNAIVDWNFDKDCGFSNSVWASDLDGTGVKNVILGTLSQKVCALADNTKDKSINPVLWSFNTDYPVQHVFATDITGDGKDEVMALASKYGYANVYQLSNTGQLQLTMSLNKGVYDAANPWELLRVDDLDGDGIKSIIAGTSRGVVVRKEGTQKWSYDFQNPVSSVLAVDLTGDGKKEVLVGSAPEVIAFNADGSKRWTWSSEEARTIYSMSSYDIDGDGKKEIVVGCKGYIFVIDDDGTEMGSWKYKVEIQGGAKNYIERDASAVTVYVGDLDGDGEAEVVAAWNWEEDTVRGNQYSTSLRAYEINKNYVKSPVTPTTIAQQGGSGDGENEITSPPTTADYHDDVLKPYDDVDEEDAGICCLPLLPALLALAAAAIGKASTLI